MKIRMDNDEDLKMMYKMKFALSDEIIAMFKWYDIDIKKLSKECIEELLVDLGRLSYEYRKITFAIDDYENKINNELEMDTNQFCTEEGKYHGQHKLPPYMTVKPEDIVPSYNVMDGDTSYLYCKGRVIDKEEK